MPYESIPLRIIGGTSQNRSTQANNELTKNWLAEISITGRNKAVLLPWPGTTAFGTSPGSTDRGLNVFQDELYQVSDATLYHISSTGVYSALGNISGTQRCIFSNSTVGTLNQMVICNGSTVNIYDGTTLSNQVFSADAATYLNSKTIYDGGGADFNVTGANGAASITSTGVAESKADELLRPYAFGQLVYMLGESTVEPFADVGSGSPPLIRQSGSIRQVGITSIHSATNTDNYLYFLGDDFNVYRMAQGVVEPVSRPETVAQISQLDTANCAAYTISLDGQYYVIFNFADGELSYAYSESTQEWFNLSTGSADGRYIGSSYVRVYGKDILADFSTGNTVEMSFDAYDDVGTSIQRRRQLPPINSASLGLGAGQRLKTDGVDLVLQTGVGIPSGQGSNPQIMCQYSTDGENWSDEQWVAIGQMGDTNIKVKYDFMASFYDLYLRITISDPVFSSLHNASIRIKGGGF